MEHSNADRLKTALLLAAMGGLLGGGALYFGEWPELVAYGLPVLAVLLLEIQHCLRSWSTKRRYRRGLDTGTGNNSSK